MTHSIALVPFAYRVVDRPFIFIADWSIACT